MFGEEGSEIIPFLMNPHLKGLVYLLILLLTCVVVLVPIFIVVKTDGAVHWNWGAVFSPLWILLAGYNGISVLLIFIGKNPKKLNSIRVAMQSILITLFFAFICARLDGRVTWHAVGYLAPLYAFEALNIIKLLPKSTKKSFINEAQGGEGGDKRSYLGVGYAGFLIRVWFWWLHRVWFLIFLTVQLDDRDWSWWVPATPILSGIIIGFVLKLADDKAESRHRHGGGEEEEESKGGRMIMSVLWFILGSLAIIFLGLLATHLDRDKFSVAVVFIPIFIVLGYSSSPP